MRRFERSRTPTSGWRRSCETPTSGEPSCRGRSNDDGGDQDDGDGDHDDGDGDHDDGDGGDQDDDDDGDE